MKYPKHDVYESLYAKYLDQESLKILMDLAGQDLLNKKIADICCGTGICTKEALLRRSTDIAMIDEEPDMIPSHFNKDSRIIVTTASAGVAIKCLSNFQNGQFDVAICRQGVNYWLNERIIESLVKMLKNGGVFVFNTFNTRPSDKPNIKQYHYKDVSFTEISYVTDDDRVHHVQIRQGYPPHIAEFDWISPEKFDFILSPYFEIEKITRNRTDYYRCVKL
jgi:ubiquinone/menaquinone biosynthesis C-methylase UbiE